MLEVVCKTAEEFVEIEDQYKIFLEKIQESTSPALPNMGYLGPSGLGYLVQPERGSWRRWTQGNGELAFLVDDANIVGVSAVENSTLSNNLGSGGNRCWLLPDYRQHNEVTTFLLESNLNWCKAVGKQGMLLSFNDYNKWIYNSIVKKSTRKAAGLGKVWSNWWDDCIPLPRKILLQNTPQWAVIKPLDKHGIVTNIITSINGEFGVN